ncbi:MAG: hypothetical protein COX62_04015 [Deltaproteobacteria bacterium CG_4_10_14_0_2_um_filter_43_8]|nr:MAG: hypothetical protein COX62_04015 [Deltaproteobacteria bacterium CG_4_10_14_0_2_um_filter_43_8]
MSRYRKIFIKMWGDGKFRNLTLSGPNGQTLWFFLLTGPQTTRIPGLFSSGEAGFAETIGWPIEGFRKVFREVLTQGMVRVDWKARLVWVPKAIHYNRPENPNVIKGWKDTWDEMPECALKLEAWRELQSFIEGLGEGFLKAFEQSCLEPSLKTLPNQEQEQEQEQEFIPPSEGRTKSPNQKEPSALAEVKQPESSRTETDPTKSRTHPRLEIFADEYLMAKGQEYLVGNFKEEGGAAKRTETKIPDESLYRQAVRAYLACTDKRLAENGFPFMWFIRELNRWVTKAQGDAHVRRDSGKYDSVCE